MQYSVQAFSFQRSYSWTHTQVALACLVDILQRLEIRQQSSCIGPID